MRSLLNSRMNSLKYYTQFGIATLRWSSILATSLAI